MSGKNRTIYYPDNCLKKGFFSTYRNIVDEIIGNRWLIFQLLKRELLSLYKQSFIGILWAFVLPLISVGTFFFLNQSGVFVQKASNIPYSVFAVFGVALWQVFSSGVIAGSASLVKAGPMIVKINFSKKSLVIASVLQSLIAFFAQVIFLIILFLAIGYDPGPDILLIIVFVIPVLFLALGLSFILSMVNGIMRDIGNVIPVFVTFLMFLTPVLYYKPDGGILKVISQVNPLYYLISFPRDMVLFGVYSEWKGYVFSVLFSIIFLSISVMVFHVTESRVAERI